MDRDGAAHLRAALDPLMRPCPGEDGLDRRTPEQRRADRPPRWRQAHHATRWIDGGDTCVDNGLLLCGYHYRLIHHSDWQVRIVDHRPGFTPPEYIDPDRKPIKGGQRRRQ